MTINNEPCHETLYESCAFFNCFLFRAYPLSCLKIDDAFLLFYVLECVRPNRYTLMQRLVWVCDARKWLKTGFSRGEVCYITIWNTENDDNLTENSRVFLRVLLITFKFGQNKHLINEVTDSR